MLNYNCLRQAVLCVNQGNHVDVAVILGAAVVACEFLLVESELVVVLASPVQG